VKRGTNRLTRDNAGRITGTGDGATARGGRLRTAGGNLRATQTAKIKSGRAGTIAKPNKLKPGTVTVATRKRPPLATRLAAFEGKLKAKTAAWKDETRKADNAFNRNNDIGWTPRAQKIVERRNRATRQGESLLKAARAFKQIDLMENPAKYGYVRGSAQRNQLAGQIKQERQSLRGTKVAARKAEAVYRESPVVKYGLTSEIGGNRRQGRKAKAAASNRLTSLADAAISTRIAAREQQRKIAELRKSARTQTKLTNRLTRRRKP
jgi:hypothetical protein